LDSKFAVIGLGLFGRTLACELARTGAEVIAVDRDSRLVQEVADLVAHAVALEATDERELRNQGVAEVDVGVVAIGENFEANALCTLILKQNFEIPAVFTRAMNLDQHKILSLMDVRVIQPEKESANRLASRLLEPNLLELIELGEGTRLVQLVAPRSLHGQPLRQLELRQRYGCNVVSIRRAEAGGKHRILIPDPDDQIRSDDELFVIGPNEGLERFARENL
jgi:trk system potassium uptake protein